MSKSVGASPCPIAIAISGSKKSKSVVKWALKKFGCEKNVVFKLIHIHPKIMSLPTPSGNTVSISEAPEDVAATYRRQVMQETKETFLKPFKKMCERKKVAVELVVLESNSVAVAITREVNGHMMSRLVIGRSSRGGLSRNYDDISAKITGYVSNLCTVYVVSKGVYILTKDRSSSSDTERNEMLREYDSERFDDTSSCSSGSGSAPISVKSVAHNKRLQTLATIIVRGVEEVSKISSPETETWRRDVEERKGASNRHVVVTTRDEDCFRDNQEILDYEITKLKAEVRRHAQDASRKLNELKLEEPTREMKVLSEKETHKRREAEMKDKGKDKLEESSLVAPPRKLQFQEFTWEEITSATSSLSEDLKIGMGAYGAVYKCNLHHIKVAVKVLHSAAETSLSKQFNQELEILSMIRHPHLVLLIGACPEKGALVYEYMENGSLEDRLFQVNNSQAIPWFVRFRIAWEVASAIVFLHKSKPTPIIHRDLKPANILLDHNFVSKVGDVGLSTMIQVDPSLLTMYKQTSPVGTLCYIDPEYQRTGMVSPKSDVYAFGMIILQLLTAQPAIALTSTVETAMESNDDQHLLQILDNKAGNWPIQETRQLTALALCCTELRARDRPDLEDHILPALDTLKKLADTAINFISAAPTQPPTHFLCPLLEDLIKEPCVAADGYTYDRRAIQDWMANSRTSPVTNSPLLNMNLLPNHTLSAAIAEWRRKYQ